MNILKIHIYLFAFLVLPNLFTDIFSSKQFSNTTVSNEQSFGCCKNKTVYNRVASDLPIATSTAQAGVDEPANHTFVPNAWVDGLDMGGSETVNHMFMENGWVNGQYISGSKTIKYMYMENECQDLVDTGGSKTFKHMYAVNGRIDMGGSESVNYIYNKCWYNNDGSKTTEFKNELHEKIRSLPNTQIKLYGL
jgi:glutaredoxin-related protein